MTLSVAAILEHSIDATFGNIMLIWLFAIAIIDFTFLIILTNIDFAFCIFTAATLHTSDSTSEEIVLAAMDDDATNESAPEETADAESESKPEVKEGEEEDEVGDESAEKKTEEKHDEDDEGEGEGETEVISHTIYSVSLVILLMPPFFLYSSRMY